MRKFKVFVGHRMDALLLGAARTIDLGATLPILRVSAISRHRTVADALASDWKKIGGDMSRAIDRERGAVSQG